MGMFDSVIVYCPHCFIENELQSKAGDCSLTTYDLYNVPEDILNDICDSKEQCYECKKSYIVIKVVRPKFYGAVRMVNEVESGE